MISVATSPADILRCFPVMQQLRPHLNEEQFLAQVRRQQQESGYTLVYAEHVPPPFTGGQGGVGEFTKPHPTVSWQDIPKQHWQYAREMRQEPTQAEKALWNCLRDRQLGVHFRRQHPLGPFIADFYCAKINLVIEVDGGTHDDAGARAYDHARDEFMRDHGLKILRFTDADVLAGGGRVMEEIASAIQSSHRPETQTPPCPPRKRRGSGGLRGLSHRGVSGVGKGAVRG